MELSVQPGGVTASDLLLRFEKNGSWGDFSVPNFQQWDLVGQARWKGSRNIFRIETAGGILSSKLPRITRPATVTANLRILSPVGATLDSGWFQLMRDLLGSKWDCALHTDKYSQIWLVSGGPGESNRLTSCRSQFCFFRMTPYFNG